MRFSPEWPFHRVFSYKMSNRLLLASGRCLSHRFDVKDSDYTFIQLADPQLGLLERYIEHRDPPFKWDRELKLVDRAVALINKLKRRPLFVAICGDLIDAEPGKEDRPKQTSDLKEALGKLLPDTPVVVLPGNHDLGNKPSAADISDYKSYWGDDYYSFWCGKTKYIVLNSQPFWDASNCGDEAEAQDSWINSELSAHENKEAENIVVFQHIPPFISSPTEADQYFNLSATVRSKYLSKFYSAGVRFVFTGHLHHNGGGLWRPAGDAAEAAPLEVVSSSAVGVQLGNDQPGLRIVRVTPNGLTHKYFTFDELECDGTAADAF